MPNFPALQLNTSKFSDSKIYQDNLSIDLSRQMTNIIYINDRFMSPENNKANNLNKAE